MAYSFNILISVLSRCLKLHMAKMEQMSAYPSSSILQLKFQAKAKRLYPISVNGTTLPAAT